MLMHRTRSRDSIQAEPEIRNDFWQFGILNYDEACF